MYRVAEFTPPGRTRAAASARARPRDGSIADGWTSWRVADMLTLLTYGMLFQVEDRLAPVHCQSADPADQARRFLTGPAVNDEDIRDMEIRSASSPEWSRR